VFEFESQQLRPVVSAAEIQVADRLRDQLSVVSRENEKFENDDDDSLHTTELREQSKPVEDRSRVLMHDFAHEEVRAHQNLAAFILFEGLSVVKTDLRLNSSCNRDPSRGAEDFKKSEFFFFGEIAVVLSDDCVNLEIIVLVSILVQLQGELAVEHPLGDQWILEQVVVVEQQF
jgi:hypothetical protein